MNYKAVVAIAALVCVIVSVHSAPLNTNDAHLTVIDWNQFNWLNENDTAANLFRLVPLNFEDDRPQVVFRAKHQNNLIPGKFYQDSNGGLVAKFAIDGTEKQVSKDYEVLFTPLDAVEWIDYEGIIPDNAISVGTDPNSYQLTFVCRAHHEEEWTVLGKVVEGKCLIPFRSKEYTYETFEILVLTETGMPLVKGKYVV